MTLKAIACVHYQNRDDKIINDFCVSASGPTGLGRVSLGPDSDVASPQLTIWLLAASAQLATFGAPNTERTCDLTNVGDQFQLMDRKCYPPGYADTRDSGGAHQRLLSDQQRSRILRCGRGQDKEHQNAPRLWQRTRKIGSDEASHRRECLPTLRILRPSPSQKGTR